MSRRAWRLTALLCAACALLSGPAHAHKPSDSYLVLDARGDRLEGRWDIALRDLDDSLGLDDNDDGAITWGELRRHEAAIAAHALPRLQIRARGLACVPRALGLTATQHSDGGYASLHIAYECPAPVDRLELTYSLLFDLDPLHRGLLRLSTRQGVQTLIFSPAQPTVRLAYIPAQGVARAAALLRAGLVQWAGPAPLLFLVALLLPAVARRKRRMDPEAPQSRGLATLAGLFGVALSVALLAAQVGGANLPPRPLAAAQLALLVLAAVAALLSLGRSGRWALAVLGGLVHGLCFARGFTALGALPEIGALAGFHAGLLLGEAALALALFGAARVVRQIRAARRSVEHTPAPASA